MLYTSRLWNVCEHDFYSDCFLSLENCLSLPNAWADDQELAMIWGPHFEKHRFKVYKLGLCL